MGMRFGRHRRVEWLREEESCVKRTARAAWILVSSVAVTKSADEDEDEDDAAAASARFAVPSVVSQSLAAAEKKAARSSSVSWRISRRT